LVRLIYEGWLPQDPCSSPGSQSRSGRHPVVKPGLPIARVRSPVDGDVTAFVVARGAPADAGAVRVGGVCQSRVAASNAQAASSRAQAIATVPASLPRRWPRG